MTPPPSSHAPTPIDVRDAIVEIGRRVWQRAWVAANDGNFSYRLDENLVLATPTRLGKGALTRSDLVLIDLEGRQLGGTRATTSEVRLHLNIYQRRPDVRSVVHVHPPFATAFAVAGVKIPKGVLEEFELYLGELPIVPYARTGTWDFARAVDPWIETHDALLLAHHGAVSVGADPFDAYYRMEVIEHACRILWLARSLMGAGEWSRLSAEQVAGILTIKAADGVHDCRAGDPLASLLDDATPPRRAAQPATPFAATGFTVPASLIADGGFPLVTDEPKKSTAPPAA